MTGAARQRTKRRQVWLDHIVSVFAELEGRIATADVAGAQKLLAIVLARCEVEELGSAEVFVHVNIDDVDAAIRLLVEDLRSEMSRSTQADRYRLRRACRLLGTTLDVVDHQT